MDKKKILVTGAAGFIGFHLCKSLIKEHHFVVGLDNINDYYDVNLKYDRLKELGIQRKSAEVYNKISTSTKYHSNMTFVRLNLEDADGLNKIFNLNKFDIVCNLAAQAGVRYSLKNPQLYIQSNINAFVNLLECCKNFNINRLVYASSSSVYGNTKTVPFNEKDNVDSPVSLYAATKKSNELLANVYSHLYKIETIGLRFFTVYGPWGRPDMAISLFTNAIVNNQPIKVFNEGKLSRDFTYIDDVIEGLVNILLNNSKDKSLNKIYNIGNGNPIKLFDFINEIEKELKVKAQKKLLPMQPGDVSITYADTNKLYNDFGFKAKTSLSDGVKAFISWYKSYFIS